MLWTVLYQAVPYGTLVLIISLWITFWFVSFVTKILEVLTNIRRIYYLTKEIIILFCTFGGDTCQYLTFVLTGMTYNFRTRKTCHCTTLRRNVKVISTRNVEMVSVSLFLGFLLVRGWLKWFIFISQPAGLILVGWRGRCKSKRTQGGRLEGQGVSRVKPQLSLNSFFFLLFFISAVTLHRRGGVGWGGHKERWTTKRERGKEG